MLIDEGKMKDRYSPGSAHSIKFMTILEKYDEECDKIHVLSRLGCDQIDEYQELWKLWNDLMDLRKRCDHEFFNKDRYSEECKLCGYSR